MNEGGNGTLNNKWAILRQTFSHGNDNLYFTFGTDDDQALNDEKMWLGTDGHVHADSYDTPSGDVAELFDLEKDVERYQPGDVLIISENMPGKLTRSTSSYSRLVAGVYATKPGVLLGDREDSASRAPIALAGVVPTKVTAENGPIALGDLLVTSSTRGHAMRADLSDSDRLVGAVIGKALGTFEGPGAGRIDVLVNLQ
jgi:hypothetical protein